MAQQDMLGKRKTKVIREGLDVSVKYHNTVVVRFNPRCIILKHNGHTTATTKTRMNQTSRQFGLGFEVFQKDFDWFVTYKGKTHPWSFDPMYLER